MNKIRIMLVTLLTCLAATFATFVAAPSAQAYSGVDMNVACKITNNNSYGWGARVDYPYQGAYGWRCHRGGWVTGVNVNAYCQVIEGSYAYSINTGDPYSWRCA